MKKNFGNIVSWSSVLIVFLGIYSLNSKILILTILIAAVLDLFDGKLARKYGPNTKQFNTFGELTDSLCDIINFGIAPSLVLISIVYNNEVPLILFLSTCVFTLSGIYRLARFSALKDQLKVEYYKGIPITIAGPLAAIVILLTNNYIIHIVILIIFSILMVSNLKIKKL